MATIYIIAEDGGVTVRPKPDGKPVSSVLGVECCDGKVAYEKTINKSTSVSIDLMYDDDFLSKSVGANVSVPWLKGRIALAGTVMFTRGSDMDEARVDIGKMLPKESLEAMLRVLGGCNYGSYGNPPRTAHIPIDEAYVCALVASLKTS